MERIRIHNLDSTEYEHPLDKTTLEALRKIPLLPKLLEICQIPQSSITRFELFGSNLRVGERQFPSIYRMLRESCEILGVDEPLLYISSHPQMSAYTFCPDKPIVCICGYLLDIMDDDEIMFVIGHELAHIKSRHIIYKTLGAILAENVLNVLISTIPGLATFTTAAVIALNYAYFEWSRAAEYTCDRGGYLACQNFTASCTALMKLAGASKKYVDELNLDEFIEQSRNFKEIDSSALGVIQKIIISCGPSRPWSVSRVGELLKFNDSGEYFDILQRNPNREPEYTPDDSPFSSFTTPYQPYEPYEPYHPSQPTASERAAQTYEKAKTAAKGAISGIAKGLLKLSGDDEEDDR